VMLLCFRRMTHYPVPLYTQYTVPRDELTCSSQKSNARERGLLPSVLIAAAARSCARGRRELFVAYCSIQYSSCYKPYLSRNSTAVRSADGMSSALAHIDLSPSRHPSQLSNATRSVLLIFPVLWSTYTNGRPAR